MKKWKVRIADPNGAALWNVISDGIKKDVIDHPLFVEVTYATFRISEDGTVVISPEALTDRDSRRGLKRALHKKGIWRVKF